MTGFGEAHRQQDGLAVRIEVRTINNRFFKLALRTAEGFGALEPQIEAMVREHVNRGTVQVNLRAERLRAPEQCKINTGVLEHYRRQLEAIGREWNLAESVKIDSLLLLPGVVDDASDVGRDAAADWPLIADALRAALAGLNEMRIDEGRAMAADLKANCRLVAENLARIQGRAPQVVAAYRDRLHERLKRTLAEHEVQLDPADVIKEVSLFADRSDISEEVVRLQSHLEQFDGIMALPESSGRKLEFLTQEMVREANTIGSKANDVEIARHVIEIKTALERIREMIQNIE
jgi:uncharacterized protein (TIGR00255 family)